MTGWRAARYADLPVGTYVRVTEGDGTYTGREYLPGRFSAGGWWAFPSQVEAIEPKPRLADSS